MSVIELNEDQERLIAEAGVIAESYGMTRISGELSALLFMIEGPLPIGDMGIILKISKPSVSTNIRFLERWEIVKRAPVRNDRRDHYEFTDDIYTAIKSAFDNVVRRDMHRVKDIISSLIQEDSESGLEVGKRISDAIELFKMAETVVDSVLSKGEISSEPVREITVE
jgi:DNA-binding transcriptional regulator GbsR (MarR family)